MEGLTAGGKLQRCRVAFLREIPVPRNVLLAGEGHGRILPECAKRFPEAKIVVVDSSQRMLDISGRKADPERVEFVLADLLEWEAPRGQFDLIVTNFFLDCFPPGELARSLRTSQVRTVCKPPPSGIVAGRGPRRADASKRLENLMRQP